MGELPSRSGHEEQPRWTAHFDLPYDEILVEGLAALRTRKFLESPTPPWMTVFNCTLYRKEDVIPLPGKLLIFQHHLGFHHKVSPRLPLSSSSKQ